MSEEELNDISDKQIIIMDTLKVFIGENNKYFQIDNSELFAKRLIDGDIKFLETFSKDYRFYHVLIEYKNVGINLLMNYSLQQILSNVHSKILVELYNYEPLHGDIIQNFLITEIDKFSGSTIEEIYIDNMNKIISVYELGCLKVKNIILKNLYKLKESCTEMFKKLSNKFTQVYKITSYILTFKHSHQFIIGPDKKTYDIVIDRHRGKFDISKFDVEVGYFFGTLMCDEFDNRIIYYSSLDDLYKLFDCNLPEPPKLS